jgi:lipopolysaccharide/colanic/teichoic acid biosynthesis glycosyltransferase
MQPQNAGCPSSEPAITGDGAGLQSGMIMPMAQALSRSTKSAPGLIQPCVVRGVGPAGEEFLGLTPAASRNKRYFDLAVAPVLLFLLFPMMLLLAFLIKVTSPGPVLFRQPRVGLHHRIFDCYKFRTTYDGYCDLSSDPVLSDRKPGANDARITPLGGWLRRLSFDELPQLLNVVKGDMSLVGPRPYPPGAKAGEALFVDVARYYALRHGVLPGITGWAQINGYRGATRTRQQLIQRLEFDLHYIKNWSIRFDIAILCRTLAFLLFDESDD